MLSHVVMSVIQVFPSFVMLSLACVFVRGGLHLLSTNHKCTQSYYFPLLLNPTTQKEKMNWNYSTRSSRLRVAPIAVPVVLWSLPLFHFIESHLSL
jgi:hypothetical protein